MKLLSSVLGLASLTLVLLWALPGAPRVQPLAADPITAPEAASSGHVHSHGMDEAAMKQWAREYWATHPRVGTDLTPAAGSDPNRALGVDATVLAAGTFFDADGDIGTAIDTVKINVGDTVQWMLSDGIHSVTNGNGTMDPEAGLMFNAPLDAGHTSFTFTFTSAGVFPYFCVPHEFFDMKGVVQVSGLTDVPAPPLSGTIGFASLPQPNPTRAGVRFSFALVDRGRVRADVVDVRGRYVATILDREFDPGTHDAVWDGRGAAGPVAAGAYYLRLLVPGYMGGKTFVITR
jgi:plastocyanin